MASSDYGLIVKKNGKIVKEIENRFCDNVYAYHIASNKDLAIYVYKNLIKIRTNKTVNINDLMNKYNIVCAEEISNNKQIVWIYSGYWRVYPIIKYRYKFTINNIDFNIKRIENGDRFYLRFRFDGDLYEIVYGYLIENDTDVDNWYDVKYLSNRCRNFIKNWVNRRW